MVGGLDKLARWEDVIRFLIFGQASGWNSRRGALCKRVESRSRELMRDWYSGLGEGSAVLNWWEVNIDGGRVEVRGGSGWCAKE